MSIKRTSGFVTSDGAMHATIEEARRAELIALFGVASHAFNGPEEIAEYILKEEDAFLDILTTGPRSRPAARKRGGTTAPKAAARRAVAAPTEKEAA